MLHWLRTAIDVYGLHPLKGAGYQWWSGEGSCLGMFGAASLFALKHNCYEHRCLRIGRVLGDDGHLRCKRHHKASHDNYLRQSQPSGS